jgi:pimeloyl-ACP methyl ester carboxylesterase
MAKIVLVHGGLHGGWCWTKVTPLFRSLGHDVFAVTLTGLGERVHLANPSIDLTTHIQDVVNTIVYEGLRDVVLVGHSYGGLVVTGAADAIADRLNQLIYVDAIVPENGESMFDIFGDDFARARRAAANEFGGGWRMPLRKAQDYGVTDLDDVRWSASRLSAHPIATYEQRIHLVGNWERVPKTYIRCVDPQGKHLTNSRASSHARARAAGWPTIDLAADHNIMITDPEMLVDCINAIISRPGQ